MADGMRGDPADVVACVGRHWGWVLAFGIITLLIGIIALVWPGRPRLNNAMPSKPLSPAAGPIAGAARVCPGAARRMSLRAAAAAVVQVPSHSQWVCEYPA
jgi:hypothetical protein